MREQGFWMNQQGFRARRGDMTPIILQLLLEKPMHGYEVISTLSEKSNGMWRPSAGTIYPTLQMLEEQGLLSNDESSGKKVYSLTDDGRKQADEVKDTFKAPWDCGDVCAQDFQRIREKAHGTMTAFRKVVSLQDEEKTAKAFEILEDAKAQLEALTKKGK